MALHLLDPLSPLWQQDRAHHGVQFRSDRVRGGVDRRDAVLMRESLRGGVGGSIRVRGGGCVPALVASGLRVGGAAWEPEGEISGSGCGRDSSEVAEIAALDMGASFSQETGAREGFVESLRDQCHRVGLFYVRNHGVSQELCDMMLATARQFFDLLTSVKNEMDYTASPQFRGYMKIGVENTAGLVDFREEIEFGPEDNAEADSDGSGDIYPVFRRLRGPNQWPPAAYVPEFQTTGMGFMEQMNVFSMHLMQALALSLGLGPDFFDSTFSSLSTLSNEGKVSESYEAASVLFMVARYPPKPAEDGNAGICVFGVGPHSDTGFLSLLLQDDAGGLQAQTVDTFWIDVPPVEGTLVVNLGEMLELATHGYYLATVHRVLSLPGTRSRTFTKVSSVHDNTGRDTSARGGQSTHGGENKLHPVFGINTFKSFTRSHP